MEDDGHGDEIVVKELRLKHREWVEDNVNWTMVDRGDLSYVKDIVKDIIAFDPSCARIKTDIIRSKNGDHYNVIFKNWNKFIAGTKFYKMFIDPDTRSRQYVTIQDDWGINPHPDGETKGPVLEINIMARSGDSNRRRN